MFCRYALLRAVDPVAGIAEARYDIAVAVEVAIDGGCPDPHIGMGLVQALMPSGAASRQTKRMVFGHIRRQSSLPRRVTANE